MLLTYIVYTLLALVVCAITYYIRRHSNVNYYVLLIPSFFYALLVGFRYETGADWGTYKEYYMSVLSGSNLDLEFGYAFLNEIIAFFSLNYQSFFIVVAFIQIGLVYIFFEQHRNILFWGILLFFIAGPFLSSLNVIRQSIAFFVFLFSLQFIIKKDWRRYLVSIFVAFSFHSSSIILLPLYLVNRINSKFLDRRFFLLAIWILSILFGETLMEKFSTMFFQLIDAPQYARYATSFLENTFSYGLGFWCVKIIDLAMIFYASKLNRAFYKEGFSVIWWIYYIGVLIFNMGMANQLTIRLSYCMTSLRFVILSFLCYYTFAIVKCKTKLITMITICILMFCVLSYYSSIAQGHNGSSPFKFAL